MALQDTLQGSFSSGGFDLTQAVGALKEAYEAVAPAGVDVDVAQLATLAGQISGTDPAAAFSSITELASTFAAALNGLGSGADLVAPVTTAVESLTSFGGQATDLKTALIGALTATHPGERPVDRFAAGTQALGGLGFGPLVDVLKVLAPGAVPALPAAISGWAGPIAQVGGFPALATQLGLLVAGSTVVATTHSLAGLLTTLADPAPLDAAQTAVLAMDGAGLAAQIGSGNPEDDIVAAVAAGLAALSGFVTAVEQMLLGGTQLIDVVDPAPLEALLVQAAATAGTADTAPVHALAQAVAGQLSVVLDLRPTASAAASVTEFADGLAQQVAPLVAAIDAVDLAKVAAPIHDAARTVLAPVRAIATTLRDAVETIRAALETIRTTIASIGLSSVVQAVHSVIDPVVGVVEQVTGLLEPIAATLGTIATQTSAAIAQLRATLDDVVGTIATAFEALADAVAALNLDQLQGLRTTMDSVAETVQAVSIATAVDEAVGFIQSAADVVDAIPFDVLPASAKSEVSQALAPIKGIDFASEVREPLSGALAGVLAEIEGPGLDQLTQAFGAVAQFLAGIDPRPELATIESEGFGAFVTAVQAIDPDGILAPIKDALSGLTSLRSLLDPADAAFDELLEGLDALDPAPLLEPVAATVDDVRAQILAALGLDRWTAEVSAACDRMLEVTDRLQLTDVLDMPLTLLDELWPAGDSSRRGLAGAQLVVRLLGPVAGPLDVLSFSVVGEWVTGRSGPAEDLLAGIAAARSAVSALRAQALALDPATVLPTVGPAFDQVAAAVAALPAGTLKDRLTPLVAAPPVQLLQPAIAGRGDLLARLESLQALLDRLGAIESGGLATLATALRAALAPLTDAWKGFGSSWVVRVGVDPGADLRAALVEVFTILADRLRPEVAALETSIRTKLAEAVDGAIRGPLTQASTDLGDLVATIDLRPLVGEVEALFATLRDPLVALRPSTALADLVTAIEGLVGDTLAWDPFRDVRVPLDKMKADLTAAADELSPSTLFVPILQSYDTVTQAVAAIDVGALFERTLTALHALESDLEGGLAAAESAFVELQDALP